MKYNCSLAFGVQGEGTENRPLFLPCFPVPCFQGTGTENRPLFLPCSLQQPGYDEWYEYDQQEYEDQSDQVRHDGF